MADSDIGDEDTQHKVDQILATGNEEEQLELEERAIVQTDNGWQPGDPEEQY